MEGYQKEQFLSKIKFLKKKIDKSLASATKAKERKKEQEKELQNLQKRESELKKERTQLLKRKAVFDSKIELFEKRDAEIRARKSKIEEDEKKAETPQQKRATEKRRWEVEDQRKELEQEKWKIEDKARALLLEIKSREREITEAVRPFKKQASVQVKSLQLLIAKKEKELLFLKKNIALETRKEKRRIVERKAREKERQEQQKREEERQEKETVRIIREGAVRLSLKKKREEQERKKREQEEFVKIQEEKKRQRVYEEKVAKQIRDVASKRHLERLKRLAYKREEERNIIIQIRKIAQQEEEYLVRLQREKEERERVEEERVIGEIRSIARAEDAWIKEAQEAEIKRVVEEERLVIAEIKRIATQGHIKRVKEREEEKKKEEEAVKEIRRIAREEEDYLLRLERDQRRKEKLEEEKIVQQIKSVAVKNHQQRVERERAAREEEIIAVRKIRAASLDRHIERLKKEQRQREEERRLILKIREIAKQEEEYLRDIQKKKEERELLQEQKIASKIQKIARKQHLINKRKRRQEDVVKIKATVQDKEERIAEKEVLAEMEDVREIRRLAFQRHNENLKKRAEEETFKKKKEEDEEWQVVMQIREIAREEDAYFKWQKEQIDKKEREDREREKEIIEMIRERAIEEENYLNYLKEKEIEENSKREKEEQDKKQEEKIIREIKHAAFLEHQRKEERRRQELEKERQAVEIIKEKAKSKHDKKVADEKQQQEECERRRVAEEDHRREMERSYEERIVKQIRILAKKREEYNREKRLKGEAQQKTVEITGSSVEKKVDDLLDIIKKNKEEIMQLKEHLEKREKDFASKEDKNKDEEFQLAQMRKNIDDESEKLNEKEKQFTEAKSEKSTEATTGVVERNFGEEKKQIDLIRQRVREEQERFRSMAPVADISPRVSSVSSQLEEKQPPQTVSKLTQAEAEALFTKAEKSLSAGSMQTAKNRFERIARDYHGGGSSFFSKDLNAKAREHLKQIAEKQRKGRKGWDDDAVIAKQEGSSRLSWDTHPTVTTTEQLSLENSVIKEEIEKILDERKKLEEEKENLQRLKGEEGYKRQLTEQRKKELEENKEDLLGKEQSTKDKKNKEQIKKEIKNMEKELRELIENETNEKWEGRIGEIEEEIASVSKKYSELTKREKYLRSKVEKISSWGPESRKKKDFVSSYRTLYKNEPKAEEEKKGLSINEEAARFAQSKKENKKKRQGKTDKIKDFFNYLKPSKDFSLGMPHLVAVDISDQSLKLFSLNKQRGVNFYGKKTLQEGIVYNGEIKKPDVLKKDFEELLNNTTPRKIKREKGRRIKVVASLPESKVFVQQLKVKKEENIVKKIEEELSRSIPVPLERLYFYYHTILLPDKKEWLVLCAAVEKRTVKQYMEFFQLTDVDPIVFDIEAASIGRVLLYKEIEKEESKKKIKDKESERLNEKEKISVKDKVTKIKEKIASKEIEKEDEAKCEMIVDIGARITTISIFYKKTMSLSVSVPFGGAYFTERIAKELVMSRQEAEEEKRSKGLLGDAREALMFSLDKIIKEIKEAKRYYKREFKGEVQEVIISGGSALIPGAIEYLQENLGDFVKVGDPLKAVKTVKEFSKQDGLVYSNAIGLALRANEKNIIDNGFNLLPEDVKKREKRLQQERKATIRVTAVMIAMFGIIVLIIATYYAFTNPQLVREMLFFLK